MELFRHKCHSLIFFHQNQPGLLNQEESGEKNQRITLISKMFL